MNHQIYLATMSRQRSDRVAPLVAGHRIQSVGSSSLPPSSVHNFTAGKERYHRNSPSVSSAGFFQFACTTSHHRRAGCGSSARVVRLPPSSCVRAVPPRSNSATFSTHSFPSSRHATYGAHRVFSSAITRFIHL